MFDVLIGSVSGILAGCVYLLHRSLARLEARHASLDRDRIAESRGLQDLISLSIDNLRLEFDMSPYNKASCSDLEKLSEKVGVMGGKVTANMCNVNENRHRCVDMEKHIETYQDINRRERTENARRFTTANTRIDDIKAILDSFTGIGCALCQGDPEHIEGQFKRLHIRIDELGKGLILTNVELDKQNNGHVTLEKVAEVLGVNPEDFTGKEVSP